MTAYEPLLSHDISSTKLHVSDRAWVTCKINGISIIKDFLDHYFTFKTFTNLQRCGDKLNAELVTLAERLFNLLPDELQSVVNKDELIYDSNDIPLSDESFKRLSVRAINVCGFNGLRSLNTILNYYIVNNGFSKFRNCGEKTQNELKLFCEQEITIKRGKGERVFLSNEKQVNKRDIINSFTPYKKSIANNYYKYLLITLSIRAKNCLIALAKSDDVYSKIFDPLFDLSDIRNAGIKTIQELESFIQNIGNFIDNLNLVNDESQLRKEFFKVTLKNLVRVKDDLFLESFGLYNEEGKIRIFKLIRLMVDNDRIFNLKEKAIFNSVYTTDQNINVNQICLNLKLTKERYRQIKIRLQEDFRLNFEFVKTFELSDIKFDKISLNADYILVDKNLKEKINQDEDLCFNELFYSEILALLLEDYYCLLAININHKIKVDYNNFVNSNYFITKELNKAFDFSSFFLDVSNRLVQKINRSYSLHLAGYLEEFFLLEKSYRDEVQLVCETIIYNEFELIPDADRFLVFETNTKKQLCDYVVEVLEKANIFLNIETITENINFNYSDLEVNSAIIRSVLQRNKQTFIFIGRSSTYGLRKWEKEKEHVKGGTIRDIVEQFLSGKNIPIHISDITKHVNKFRKTNDKNILSNLKLEDNKRFVFYEGSFIGLKNKQYGSQIISLKRIKGTHFREVMLKRFSGYLFKDIVSHYVKVYKYQPSQVEYILVEKEKKGQIKFDSNKILRYE